jgi:predicted DNA-binding transcriptional regulator AlpA
MNDEEKALAGLFSEIASAITRGDIHISKENIRALHDMFLELDDRRHPMSKDSLCSYLHMGKVRVGNLIENGELPGGRHMAGFKGCAWYRREVDEYVAMYGYKWKKKTGRSSR